MALEDLTGTGKFISALNPAWPVDDDWVDEGDNHIRGIKNVLRNTFPNVNAAVVMSDEQLNYVPVRLLGRASGASAAVAVKWGATLANDPTLVAVSVEVEQVCPVSDAIVAFGFYRNDPTAGFPVGSYTYVGMSHNVAAASTLVGSGASAANEIAVGNVLAGANVGVSGRLWWAMPTGTAILRGVYDLYSYFAVNAMGQTRGSFQVTPAERPGGLFVYAGSGGVGLSVGNVTVWGHYFN